MKSQNAQLLAMMRERWISPVDALIDADCFRLAARVKDLRDQGHNVVGRWAGTKGAKRWREYRVLTPE